jgi:hypothetical protein
VHQVLCPISSSSVLADSTLFGVPDLVKTLAGGSQSSLESPDQKIRVSRNLIMLLCWFFGHTRMVFSEMGVSL